MDVLNANRYIISELTEKLPLDLYYHAVHHTIDVLRFSEILAVAEGVTGDDLLLVQTAAAYHDSGFLEQYNNNEPIACDIVKKTLPGFNYTDSQIEKICKIIMATRIPQKPVDILGEIVCDADLDYLGTYEFYSQGDDLRKEMAARDTTMSDRVWIQLEIDFLEQHSYHTATCKMLRNELKAKHISELKQNLEESS